MERYRSYIKTSPSLVPKTSFLCSICQNAVSDDEYGEDDDPLAPEQPPQLYIPDWNAFNAGANVAAAAANAVRGALGNPCCSGGGGGGGGMLSVIIVINMLLCSVYMID